MAQSALSTTQSSFPLPDAFSTALTALFQNVQPGIVQVYRQGRGGGTGVIWDAEGHIITNNHVVGRSDDRIEVQLADGRTLPARVLQRNPELDLAQIKVSGESLTALAIGDSSQLRVGEWVFAIGHPWGQRWSITAGIVSTTSSVKLAEGVTTSYIKSDVLLAPGNSGGPLLNAEGQVVGINAMIFGGDLSISIPSKEVQTWLNGLPKSSAALGIAIQTVELPGHLHQNVQPERSSGLLIRSLLPERQGRHNDLLLGDLLLDVTGQPVTNGTELRALLAQHEAGKSIQIRLARAGEVITIDVATVPANPV
jgi:serine protease Do